MRAVPTNRQEYDAKWFNQARAWRSNSIVPLRASKNAREHPARAKDQREREVPKARVEKDTTQAKAVPKARAKGLPRETVERDITRALHRKDHTTVVAERVVQRELQAKDLRKEIMEKDITRALHRKDHTTEAAESKVRSRDQRELQVKDLPKATIQVLAKKVRRDLQRAKGIPLHTTKQAFAI